jgi:pyridinium-3,5-biscarboxylic acid mononucleotide sulfurtransferase
VRSAGDTARIEVMPEVVKQFVAETDLGQLIEAFQGFGFLYVTLDLEGFRSGKLNDVLNLT